MASQLEIQAQLTKALEANNELLEEQAQLVKTQLSVVVGLKQAWSQVNPDIDDILGTIKKTREALDEVRV